MTNRFYSPPSGTSRLATAAVSPRNRFYSPPRGAGNVVEEAESLKPPSLLSRMASGAGSVLHGVGDVVSMPFRGLGMLGTAAQEHFGETPAESSRLTVRPEASGWDRALGADINAPTPARLAIDAMKSIPQYIEGTADVSQAGGIRGEDEITRRGFERGHRGLAQAEAIAEPVGEFGAMLLTDPSLAGLSALTKAAKAGNVLRESIAMGNYAGADAALTAAATKAMQAGKYADYAGRGIAASFVPGMAQGAIQEGGEFLRAGAEEGYTSPAALRAGVGALTSGGMALMTGLHAAKGTTHGMDAKERLDEASAEAYEMDPAWRRRKEAELGGPVIDPYAKKPLTFPKEEPLDLTTEAPPLNLDAEPPALFKDRPAPEKPREVVLTPAERLAQAAAEQEKVGADIVAAGEGFDPLMEKQTALARAAKAQELAELDARAKQGTPSERQAAEVAAREAEGIAAQEAERAAAAKVQAEYEATSGLASQRDAAVRAAKAEAEQRAGIEAQEAEKALADQAQAAEAERLALEQKSAAPPGASPAATPLPAREPSSPAQRQAIAEEYGIPENDPRVEEIFARREATRAAEQLGPVPVAEADPMLNVQQSPPPLAPDVSPQQLVEPRPMGEILGTEKPPPIDPVQRRAELAQENPNLAPEQIDMIAKAETDLWQQRVLRDAAIQAEHTRVPPGEDVPDQRVPGADRRAEDPLRPESDRRGANKLEPGEEAPFEESLDPGDRAEFEQRVTERHARIEAKDPHLAGEAAGRIARAEERAIEADRWDVQTGVLSKNEWWRRQRAMAAGKIPKAPAYSEVDLMGARETNKYGDDFTDARLHVLAQTLKRWVGKHGKVHRKGGDEFAIEWNDARIGQEMHSQLATQLNEAHVEVRRGGEVVAKWKGVGHHEGFGLGEFHNATEALNRGKAESGKAGALAEMRARIHEGRLDNRVPLPGGAELPSGTATVPAGRGPEVGGVRPADQALTPKPDSPSGAAVPETKHATAPALTSKPPAVDAASMPPAQLEARIKTVFPGLQIHRTKEGNYVLPTRSGETIMVSPKGEIIFDAAALKAGHGKDAAGDIASGKQRIAGSTQSIGRETIIQLVDAGVLPHEAVHAFLNRFATAKEREVLRREFEKKAQEEGRGREWDEVAADAYNEWFDKPETVRGPVGQFFARIKEFVGRIRQAIDPTSTGIFKKLKSGEPFQREAVDRGATESYATEKTPGGVPIYRAEAAFRDAPEAESRRWDVIAEKGGEVMAHLDAPSRQEASRNLTRLMKRGTLPETSEFAEAEGPKYATQKVEERFGERPRSAKEARALADKTKDPGDIAHAERLEANRARSLAAMRGDHDAFQAGMREKVGEPKYATRKVEKGEPKAPGEMRGAELSKAIEKARTAGSRINAEFIAAGRGDERPSDRVGKTDELSVRDRENADLTRDLQQEVVARAGPGWYDLPRGVGGKPRVKAEPKYATAPADPVAAAAEAVGDRAENFRKWFGPSKIVDEQGAPLKVYHGTGAAFTQFDAGRTATSPRGNSSALGFFFTKNKAEGSHYATGYRDGGGVMPTYLSIRNPFKMESYSDLWDRTVSSRAGAKEVQAELRAAGHDGAITPNGEYVAFDPTQIKSATGNSGAFDPKNPDIRYATAPAEPPSVSKIKPIPEKPREVEKETVLGKEGRAAAIKAANAGGGEVPTGKPGGSPDASINWDRVSTEDHIKAMQGRIAEAIAPRLKEARGYQSEAETHRLALESGLTEKDIIRMARDKEGFTAKSIEAGRMMREESAIRATDKIDAAKKLKNLGGDETKILEAEREADAAAALHAAVTWATVRAGSETGRALAIHRKLSEGLTPSERFFKKALKEVPLMTEAQRTALAKAVLGGDSNEIAKVAREAFQPSRMNQFLEYWKAGLVSGPATIGGNFISNSLFETWRTLERGGAGTIDAVYSKVTGAERTRYAGEAFKALTSLQTSVPRAMSIFWDVLKDPRSDFDINSEARVEHSVPQIPGKLGEVVRTPFRILKAFDEAAKHIAGQNELFAQSYRLAKMEGGGNIDAKMADLVKQHGEYYEAEMARKAGAKLTAEQRAALQNPHSQRMAASIEKAQKQATFQDEAGKITQGILLMRGTSPLWQLILPFVRTPARLLSAGLERTPLGFAKVWKGIHEGSLKDRGEIADAMIKPMIGTMLGIGFVAAAKNGLITGSGPTDLKERKLKLATGWQPYSIKVGDSFVSYKRLEPLATTLGLASDLVEASAEDRGKIAEKIQAAIVDNITSKSYLQGVANFGELIADPKRYGPTFLKNLEGSLVPNIVKKAAEAIDPVVRDTSGPIGAITSRIPGLSMTLDEKRGATGEGIERGATALERFASPFQRSAEKDAPLERELLEIDYSPSAPTKSINVPGTGGKVKVELTKDEYAIMQDFDKQASDRVRKALKAPGYRAMPPEARQKYVRRLYDQAGAAAKAKVTQSADFRARAKARYAEFRGTA